MNGDRFMTLGHIELFVRDPLQSRNFYCDILGFEVVAIQEEKFVWLRSGQLEILLRPGSAGAAAPEYWNAPAGIVLYSDDLDRDALRLLKQGIEFRGNDGSDRCLTFTDLDDHWFQLVDPNDHRNE
jgi:catechol 2,3-dioxygenase-like lactoylglutathione lyase family enzyme